jgi:hypothetical protein
MKSLFFLVLLFLVSCNSTVNKQKIAVSKTKDFFLKSGKVLLGVDTIITNGIAVNYNITFKYDSIVNVVVKGKSEYGFIGYFNSQTFFYKDSVKETIISSSGIQKEHCLTHIRMNTNIKFANVSIIDICSCDYCKKERLTNN